MIGLERCAAGMPPSGKDHVQDKIEARVIPLTRASLMTD
jgi:hypothetical protein